MIYYTITLYYGFENKEFFYETGDLIQFLTSKAKDLY